MKFKENMKRFWTLSRSNGGFTLVELIVVIAILAILGGVAISAYSAYITRANRGVDESLASEIEHAMMIAYYDGTLQPGASVVVYYGDEGDANYDVVVDPDGTDLGAAAAMSAAFGDNYATSLRLKWSGWKDQMGVAADATMMGYVNGSNFKPENMGEMLGEVQEVVNAASNALAAGTVIKDSALDQYLNNAGIPHDTIDESNAGAIANALVFVTADKLAAIDVNDANVKSKFWGCWQRANFSSMGWDDPAAEKAAAYGAAYAMATYVDNYTKNDAAPTKYCEELGGEGTAIVSSITTVFNKIARSSAGTPTNDAYKAYSAGGESSMMYSDAMAFLAYMKGVSSSADSLTGKTDLYNDKYFTDGTVLNYVNDYVSISDVLTGLDTQNGAFVFHFNGETVSCLPLDY